MNWTYDEQSETWLYGTETVGAGVFQDEKGWEANVCNSFQGLLLGPYLTKERAMEEAIAWLNKIQEN